MSKSVLRESREKKSNLQKIENKSNSKIIEEKSNSKKTENKSNSKIIEEKSNSKKIRGLYISTDGKIDPEHNKKCRYAVSTDRNIDTENNKKCRYVVGTFKQFNEILTGDKNNECAYDYLDNDLKVLYNNRSTEPHNKFISRYVTNTEIYGPVIIIKNKGDIELDAHKTLGKKILTKVDWLGISIC